jgi:hypothetical protein
LTISSFEAARLAASIALPLIPELPGRIEHLAVDPRDDTAQLRTRGKVVRRERLVTA